MVLDFMRQVRLLWWGHTGDNLARHWLQMSGSTGLDISII